MLKIPKYGRIIFACIFAFGVSYIISARHYVTPTQFNLLALKNDMQTVVAGVSSFHFELPHFELFSQKIEPTQEPEQNNTPEPTIPDENVPPEIPTSTPYIQPTTGGVPINPNNPTVMPRKPTVASTQAPQPTKKPKPTVAPDVFPIDSSLKRPGTTVDEIFTIAAQKACIPKAALRTIASIESGGFFTTVSPKYLLLYNSYNWWNSEFITDPVRVCSGYAYDGNTGLVPTDSKYPGYKCRDGSGSGLGVMGVTQVSPREFTLYSGDAARALGVKTVDRRVILDALIMTGIAIQREVHAGSCSSWNASQMVKGACSYYGSCNDNYCATFCRNLKTFGGGDCSGAIGQYANSCW